MFEPLKLLSKSESLFSQMLKTSLSQYFLYFVIYQPRVTTLLPLHSCCATHIIIVETKKFSISLRSISIPNTILTKESHYCFLRPFTGIVHNMFWFKFRMLDKKTFPIVFRGNWIFRSSPTGISSLKRLLRRVLALKCSSKNYQFIERKT